MAALLNQSELHQSSLKGRDINSLLLLKSQPPLWIFYQYFINFILGYASNQHFRNNVFEDMWISVTSVFHQPILCVHIMSHQNSVFVAFIDQHTNPAKAKSIALTDRSSTQDSSVFKLLTSLYSYIALWLFLGTEKTLSLYLFQI